jgi:hypothetical protein
MDSTREWNPVCSVGIIPSTLGTAAVRKSCGRKKLTMRKSFIDSAALEPKAQPGAWLDVDRIAQVQVTSEDSDYPVESVFSSGNSHGWRAGVRGKQTIRLIFDHPQPLKRIWLRFEETGVGRTQEFVLRWSPGKDGRRQEIVRQQWNFSPDGSTVEVEDYAVDLKHVWLLELAIDPDLNRREAFATLSEWRLA